MIFSESVKKEYRSIKKRLKENEHANVEAVAAEVISALKVFDDIQNLKLSLLNKALLDHGFPKVGEDLAKALKSKQTKMYYRLETKEEFYYIDEKLIFTFKY